MSEIPADLPNLDPALFQRPDPAALFAPRAHPPRFLLLYGSLRERSYSRLAAEGRAPDPGAGRRNPPVQSVRPAAGR